MPTDLITLRTVEETMADYVPVYVPFYPLFMGKSRQYDSKVGQIAFRRVEAVGDIRQRRILPKDTEIKQINVTDANKTFAKYFFANQYVVSELQDQEESQDVVTQVLDEHQLQADELLMLGDGTSNETVLNNGLYFSQDSNYVLESSIEVALANRLMDLHTKIVATATEANQVAGKKVILLYGDTLMPYANSLYDTAVRAWKAALLEVLGPDYEIIQVPKAITPAGANGWIIVNMDQVRLHYTLLPALVAQGNNEEKMYYWFNFKMGSMMLEVLAKGGVIRQPVTFALS